MVINIADLKLIIKQAVMDSLDHKSLDKDVPYFKTNVSTVEHVALYIWSNLIPLLPAESLYEVKVHETDKNIAVFRGEYQ